MRLAPPDVHALLAELEAFARAYPSVGAHLSGAPQDPDVERLLEAIAFSASRVREVARRAEGHRIFAQAEALCPELLRPFPSATTLELAPTPAFGPQPTVVPAGFEVDSEPVDGVRCRFRSFGRVPVTPFHVTGARLAWEGGSQELVVALHTTSAQPAPFDLGILHVGGDLASAALVVAWLRLHLEGVWARQGDGPKVALPSNVVRPVGFRDDEALLPPEASEHPGLRLLREYLLLPGRFSFAEVDLRALTMPTLRLEIGFRFRRPLPSGVKLAADSVRVNVAPVVNVFAAPSEPVRPSLEGAAHVLAVTGRSADGDSVYAVRSARAFVAGRGSVPLPCVAAAGADARMTYETQRADDGTWRVSVRAPRGAPPLPALNAASFDLWATDGSRPRALGLGAVRFRSSGLPEAVTVRNVTAVTPFRPATLGEGLRARLASWLALSGSCLASPSALRTLLFLFDLHAAAGEGPARRSAVRRAAIQSVDVTSESRCFRTAGWRRGHGVDLRLHGSGFDGEGDLFAFAAVLHQLFAHEVSLGSYVRTRVASSTSDLSADLGAQAAARELR